MLFAPMDFQDLTLDTLIDSGALVNCMSEADYQKIHREDIVKEMEWNHHHSNFKSQMATLKLKQRQNSSISKSGLELQRNFQCCPEPHRTHTRRHTS